MDTKLDAAGCALSEADSILTVAASILADAQQKVKQCWDKVEQARAAILGEALASVRELGGSLLGDASWRAGLGKGDSWGKYATKADEAFKDFDIKQFEGAVAAGFEACKAHKAVLDSMGKKLDVADGAETAEALLKKATVIKAEASILWHFENEDLPDKLREQNQGEIRALRARNIVEKDELHPSCFKKCHEALMMRKSRTT